MRRVRQVCVGISLLALVAGAALAQGPGGPGGGFGGPGGGGARRPRSPQFQLRGTVQALGEMEKGKRCPLKADQAQKIVAIVVPLQKKPKLTEAEAKAADAKIRKALTIQQLNELSRISKEIRERRMAEFRKMRERMMQGGGPGGRPGMGGPGMGGPGMGGPGGPGGAGRPQFDRNAFKDMNPFLPPKTIKGMDPQITARFQQGHKRLQEAIGALQKKAKQK